MEPVEIEQKPVSFPFVLGVLAASLLTLGIVAGLGSAVTTEYYERQNAIEWQRIDTKWRAEAVEHGAAEYDAKTGAWRWKTSVKGKHE